MKIKKSREQNNNELVTKVFLRTELKKELKREIDKVRKEMSMQKEEILTKGRKDMIDQTERVLTAFEIHRVETNTLIGEIQATSYENYKSLDMRVEVLESKVN